MDYEKLSEITVKSQDEFNQIPDDFKGHIYIEFGTPQNRAIINRLFYRSVVARENSHVEAYGNSHVEACGNSHVLACGNSHVIAYENSSVEAWGNSSVEAWGNSNVFAYENSSVEAWGNSNVFAYGNSSVEAWGNSSVEAWGNSQIVDRTFNHKIKLHGNSRIVRMPKNINDFIDFYAVKHTKTTATMYKAVHKIDGRYISDYSQDFEYAIGKIKRENCDTDTTVSCSNGIHISHLSWALKFGEDWDDLAILECRTKISDIVMPDDTDGKVRTSQIKVLREVPLEECGTYGKILAGRKNKEE